jgi:hypothetical protein
MAIRLANIPSINVPVLSEIMMGIKVQYIAQMQEAPGMEFAESTEEDCHS